MALVPMKAILDAADEGGFGVPALNINEMLQLQAYLNAAFELRSPLILQASMGSRKFTGWLSGDKKPDPNLGAMVTIKMVDAFMEGYKEVYGYDVPVSVHLDHGPDLESCVAAIDADFQSVMIDGSLDYSKKDEKGKHPARDYEDNISVTKAVVGRAHERGVSVEGELGTLGGIEGDTAASEVQLTDPDQVTEFVERTGVDALAVAIGTSHGAYKFKTEPKLAMELIPEIYENAGDARLVMHGSSSVPMELVDVLNSYPVVELSSSKGNNSNLFLNGFFREIKGDAIHVERDSREYYLKSLDDAARFFNHLRNFSCMQKSMGVPMEQIKEAIGLGIRKINVDTDGRLGTTGAIKKYMAENPDDFDQRGYFGAARDALYEMAVLRINGFGSSGHAGDVERIGLDEMAGRYD